MLQFLSTYVWLGTFRDVVVNFLPVGHTHEDIDGMFGCFARRLRVNVSVTIPELAGQIKDAFKYHHPKDSALRGCEPEQVDIGYIRCSFCYITK